MNYKKLKEMITINTLVIAGAVRSTALRIFLEQGGLEADPTIVYTPGGENPQAGGKSSRARLYNLTGILFMALFARLFVCSIFNIFTTL